MMQINSKRDMAMDVIKYNEPVSKFDYMLVTYVMLCASRGCFWFYSLSFYTDIAGSVLSLFFFIRLLYKKWGYIEIKDFRLLFIYDIWFLAQYLFKECPFTIVDFVYSNYILCFTILLAKYLGKRFFCIFVDVVYFFVVISIPLWLLCLTPLYSTIENLMFFDSVFTKNAIIFTLPRVDEGYMLLRNCGPAWEPGIWAIIIGLALFVNFTFSEYNLLDKKTIIFFIGVFSTLSTTGYGILLFCIVPIILINQKGTIIKILLFPMAIIIVLFLWNQEFVGDKISNLQYQGEDVFYESAQKAESSEKGALVLQRFDGIALDYLNFTYDPFLGYGKFCQSYSYNYISENIGTFYYRQSHMMFI